MGQNIWGKSLSLWNTSFAETGWLPVQLTVQRSEVKVSLWKPFTELVVQRSDSFFTGWSKLCNLQAYTWDVITTYQSSYGIDPLFDQVHFSHFLHILYIHQIIIWMKLYINNSFMSWPIVFRLLDQIEPLCDIISQDNYNWQAPAKYRNP